MVGSELPSSSRSLNLWRVLQGVVYKKTPLKESDWVNKNKYDLRRICERHHGAQQCNNLLLL